MKLLSPPRPDTGPTGDTKPTPAGGQWSDRRWLGRVIKLVVVLAPIVVSVVFVAVASRGIRRPDHWVGVVAWWVGLTLASTFVLAATERVLRKLLPLAALFRLSLVFPDHAPSRFKVAMRTNTLRQLQRTLEAGELADSDFQAAAERLVALAGALNAHDRMTRGHTERVRAYTLMIGEELHLAKPDLDRLHWAGLVHDIGKLEVPPAILNKQGRPDEEEWAILKQHPAAAVPLLEPLRPWLGEWADAASQHHERWDGKGYPFGLAGEQISLSGRIVAVADAFDVMTSVRSYKKAMAPEDARAELARCAGTQFDPDVVRAFLNISVGKLRLVMGPLSWVAQAPALGNVPIGAGAVTAVSSAVSLGIAVAAGMTGGHDPAPHRTLPPVVAEAPTAQPITINGLEDEPLTIALANIDQTPTRVAIVAAPPHTRRNESSSTTLIPDANWFGASAGQYEACWDDACSISSLEIEVRSVNDSPVAADDGATTPRDTPVSIDVLVNDTDIEDGRPVLTDVSASAAGATSITPDGIVRFEPAAGFVGIVTIGYDIADQDAATAHGSITVEVTENDNPPQASDDDITTRAGSTETIDVLANDTDDHTEPLTIIAVTPPAIGQVVLSADTITYQSPPGTNDHTSFTYTIEDDHGGRAQATVSVTILDDPPPTTAPPPTSPPSTSPPATTPAPTTPPPAPTTVAPPPPPPSPTARPDQITILEDSGPTDIDVIVNDTSADGDPTNDTLTILDQPSIGTAQLANQRVRYQPIVDANGVDTLVYRTCETTGTCASTTVTITIEPRNDPPQFTDAGNISTNEDNGPTAVTAWANAIDTGATNESGQNIGFTVTTDQPGLFSDLPAVDATGTLTFTPAADANGTATITVTAVDDGGTTNAGNNTSTAHTATITINPVNDTPSFDDQGAIIVNEDAGTTTIPGWATSISAGPANETDQTMTFTVDVDQPTLFTSPPAIDPLGTLSFTPAPDANGTANITITATDDGGSANGGADTSIIHTAAITISAVNDPPQFADLGDVTVDEDRGPTTIAGWAHSIAAGPSDESAQLITFSAAIDQPTLFASAPSVDTAGTLTFTPAPNANGTAAITITATDDAGTANDGTDTSNPHTATITINSINDPVNATDDSATIAEDDPAGATINALANDTDADNDPLAITAIDTSSVIGGTVTDLGSGNINYTADPDFNGTETFTYTVTDGNGSTDTSTITVTITATPDAPMATGDAYATAEDTALVAAAPGLLGNDWDEDGDTITITPSPVSGPANGTLALATDGSFTYTPGNGFVGTDTFTYQLNDGTGRTATGSVTITVDSGLAAGHLYLGTTPNLGTWNMTAAPPANANPEPDHDLDGHPGITVAKDGALGTRTWTRSISGTPLALNGPVTLELWSTIENFDTNDDGHPDITLYDCNNLGLSCTTLTNTDIHIDHYNNGVANWVKVDISLGNITHTFAVGRQLRLQIQQGHHDLWIAATGTRPSRLSYTIANTAPLANNDSPPALLEDAAATNLDVLANDTDSNLDPTSTTITTPPTLGTATPQPDGSITYLPNPNANGTDTLTYRICDTGGLCDTANVTITITPVNDPPNFTAGPDITINASDPSYTHPGWATTINRGPPNESGQSLSFTVTASDPTLFSVQPAVDSAGTLTFTPTGTPGSATITVSLVDNGGTANGGNNNSPPQTANITLL